MHRPEPRSTSRDNPAQPSMPASAGITVSRMCVIPTSMNDGCASMVVERAYTVDTLQLGRRPAAPTGQTLPHSHSSTGQRRVNGRQESVTTVPRSGGAFTAARDVGVVATAARRPASARAGRSSQSRPSVDLLPRTVSADRLAP